MSPHASSAHSPSLGTRIRAARAWLLGLGWLIDLGFIQFDRMYLQGRLGERFSLGSETSYPERYQNAKELGLTVLAGICVSKNPSPLYRCWLGIFAYFFVDDTFELHETLGAWMGGHFQLTGSLGLRGADLGELVVSGLAGFIACASLIAAWRRSDENARRASRALISLVAALALFGIVTDMLHVVVTGAWRYRLGILEDGGELIVITAMLWFMYAHGRFLAEGPER